MVHFLGDIMAIIIKFALMLGLILGIYGYVSYASSPHGKSIYCQMTYLWLENQNEMQSKRPGWPPFDPTIKCEDGKPI